MYQITLANLQDTTEAGATLHRRTLSDVEWVYVKLFSEAFHAYRKLGELKVLDMIQGQDEDVVTLGFKESVEVPLLSISVVKVPYESDSGLMDIETHVMLAR